MTRWSIVISMIAGGLLLTLPTNAVARCSGSGPTFRCDPIVSESLRRRYNGLPPRYTTPSTPKKYQYEGRTYSAPSGALLHRYTHKDGLGNTYKGTIESLPSGTVRHRGSWR